MRTLEWTPWHRSREQRGEHVLAEFDGKARANEKPRYGSTIRRSWYQNAFIKYAYLKYHELEKSNLKRGFKFLGPNCRMSNCFLTDVFRFLTDVFLEVTSYASDK